MVARSFDPARRGVPRVHQLPRPAADRPGPQGVRAFQPPVRASLKPRLTAIAPNLADIVTQAGGWLFDQVMAGWEVNVITADDPDERALRILGARGHHLDQALAAPLAGSCLEAVAIRTDLYVADERVRSLVLKATENNDAEIRFWGDAWPDEFDAGSGGVCHELSIAARAFKAQALKAVATTGSARAGGDRGQEVFRRGTVRRPALAAVR